MKTLTYALRFLMRSKSYTLINLLGLAFSLACSIILMRYIHIFKAEDLGSSDAITVKSVNSLWVDDNFSIRNRYLFLLQKDFDALATSLNFSDPSTVEAINNWCSEHTNGKITKIIDKLGPNSVMVLANALYFNAPWLNPFDGSATAKADFNGSVGRSQVDMMVRRGYMNYAEYNGCQLVELPYEGGRYSMYVLLPSEGRDSLLQKAQLCPR